MYSHIFTVPSVEQEHNLLSFNLIIQITFELCPLNSEQYFLFCISHIIILLSKLPEAKYLLSIWHIILTACMWALRVPMQSKS